MEASPGVGGLIANMPSPQEPGDAGPPRARSPSQPMSTALWMGSFRLDPATWRTTWTWTCPERADTSDVGVSPRGGSPNGEEGGGERGTPAATPVVHAEVQGRGHRLGAAGGAVVARDLPRARPE